jgi:hypothetical protein
MSRTAYCVILCRRPVEHCQPYPRTRRFYVGAASAEHALTTASRRNPQYKPIGVEPSDLPRLEFDSFAGVEAMMESAGATSA